MKKLILLLIVLSYSSVKAQYHDLIVTNEGDSIICNITMVNDHNIFYNYKKKKTEQHSLILLSLVKSYTKGDKAIIIKDEVVRKDKITLLDGKSYDVHITKEDHKTIYFYSLSDSSKTIKKVPKAQTLSYQKSDVITNTTGKNSVGDELIIAQNHWYTGVGLQMLAAVIVIIPSELTADERKIINIIGGAVALTGTIFAIESWSHIGKAGEKLNAAGLSLGIGGKGVSLCYKF